MFSLLDNIVIRDGRDRLPEELRSALPWPFLWVFPSQTIDVGDIVVDH